METIKSNDEITKLFKSGKHISNKYVSFIYLKLHESDRGPCGRVAFIAGKKNGNAVWRNSAKRRMREIYRTLSPYLKGYQVLFVAKSGILDSSYSKVLNACEMTLYEKLTGEGNSSCQRRSK